MANWQGSEGKWLNTKPALAWRGIGKPLEHQETE